MPNKKFEQMQEESIQKIAQQQETVHKLLEYLVGDDLPRLIQPGEELSDKAKDMLQQAAQRANKKQRKLPF